MSYTPIETVTREISFDVCRICGCDDIESVQLEGGQAVLESTKFPQQTGIADGYICARWTEDNLWVILHGPDADLVDEVESWDEGEIEVDQ